MLTKTFQFIKKYLILISLLGVLLLKSTIWLYIFPILQTPDEQAHFGYIQFLVEEGRLPRKNDDKLSLEVMAVMKEFEFKRVVYETKEKYNYSKEQLEQKINQIKRFNNKHDRSTFDLASMTALGTPPLYYLFGSAVYKIFYPADFFVRFYALRAFSVILSFVTFYFLYLAGNHLFKSKISSLLFASAVLLQPMFSMTAISINPDNLVFVFFAALLYIIARALEKKEFSITDNLWASIFIGSSFMVKQYGIILLFMYCLALCLVYRTQITKLAARAGFVLGVVFIFSGWWYLFNPQYFGGKLINEPGGYWPFFLFKLPGTILSYWGNFGWFDTPLKPSIYYPIAVFFIVFTAVSVPWLVFTEKDKRVREIFIIFAGTVLFNLVFIYYLDYKAFLLNNHFVQGRYFLTTLPLAFYLLIKSINRLFSFKEEAGAYLLFYLMLILNIISVYCYIIPRYYVL